VEAARSTPTWNRRGALVAARLSFLSIAVWVGLTTLLAAVGPRSLHALFDLPFHVLCHRIPERILSIAGAPMPICSRCAGIWIGLSLSAAIAWPRISLRALRVVFPIALFLMFAEVVTQDMGLHPVFHPTRLLTGLLVAVPFGGALGGLITRELGR
jgi:uncharacterized membrane protein